MEETKVAWRCWLPQCQSAANPALPNTLAACMHTPDPIRLDSEIDRCGWDRSTENGARYDGAGTVIVPRCVQTLERWPVLCNSEVHW